MRALAVSTLALVLGACGEAPPADGESPAAESVRTPAAAVWSEPVTDAEAVTATARRLAGMLDGTAPDDPVREPVWREHEARFDAVWELVLEHEQSMRDFASRHVAPRLKAPELPLLSPFSGPNFLDAAAFFPQATTYVLTGQQPPGEPPRIDALEPRRLAAELERLRTAYGNLAEAGYFVTTQMDEEFAGDHLGGVLPALYVFLARAGHRPIAVRPLALDEAGQLVAPAPGTEVRIVEILFDGAEPVDERTPPTPRRLLYFGLDLSDAGLDGTHPEYRRFLESLGPFNVFIKAGEFLLHMPEFSSLSELLLARGQDLLQDDSGLPHRAFDPALFELDYFGTYTENQPAAYRKWLQDDLLAAYEERSDIPALGFAVGYQSQLEEGSLILARRR